MPIAAGRAPQETSGNPLRKRSAAGHLQFLPSARCRRLLTHSEIPLLPGHARSVRWYRCRRRTSAAGFPGWGEGCDHDRCRARVTRDAGIPRASRAGRRRVGATVARSGAMLVVGGASRVRPFLRHLPCAQAILLRRRVVAGQAANIPGLYLLRTPRASGGVRGPRHPCHRGVPLARAQEHRGHPPYLRLPRADILRPRPHRPARCAPRRTETAAPSGSPC